MKRILLTILVTSSLLMSFVALGEDIPRKIIAFYDPQEGPDDFYFTNVHQRAQMPLNFLGLDVIPWSITAKLPSEQELEGVLGFVTWFNRADAFENPDQFCSYLSEKMSSGYKWLSLGGLGIYDKKTNLLSPTCIETLKIFGLKDLGNDAFNPYFMSVVKKDSQMVEFERKFQLSENVDFHQYQSLEANSKIYLKLKRTDIKNSNSDMVFTNSKGGFVAPRIGLYYVKSLDKAHWRVNPFLFYEEALGLKHQPRVDVTTINGQRIFFSHIDGDGIVNVSQFDHQSFSGELIYKNILTQYPRLPITISLITGYFDIPEYNTEYIQTLYKNMLRLSNVEVSSHGYAHPLSWKKGTLALKIPGYSYSSEKEITGSIEQLNDFLDKNGITKRVNLFQWTGDCLPDASAMQTISKEKFLNINGGDSRFDTQHDSYAWVAPLGIHRGGGFQVYTGAPNENVYTNLWRGPYYGYKSVIESFKNTENPRRVKPINIYYHYYSGERLASLNALKQAYEYAVNQKTVGLFASEYAQLAQDFKDVLIKKISPYEYLVLNKGAVRTIRFDNERRFVDIKKSHGVLGYLFFQNSLYVSMDESDQSKIVLTQKESLVPYVKSANFLIRNFKIKQNQITFEKKGWGESVLVLDGFNKNRSVKLKINNEVGQKKQITENGVSLILSSNQQDGDWTPVEITIEYL